MKNSRTFLLVFFVLALFSCKKENIRLSEKVNPFIGTDGHGHTYPGVILPFGMMQLSPDTRLDGWDGCSGYHYSDSVLYGFSHTHLSGTGCSDYGDILILPVSGELVKDTSGKAISHFDHKNEKAVAGYYHTRLDDYKIDIDLTATQRCGMYKCTFDNPESAQLILDLVHRDLVNNASLNKVSDTEIEGYRFSTAWGSNQMLFFVAQFSKPIKAEKDIVNTPLNFLNDSLKDAKLQKLYSFDLKGDKQLMIKIGISAVSIEGARKNLNQEIPDWNFDTIRENAQKIWDKELGKIEVKGGTDDEQTTFYTALYHSMSAPNLYMDVDGQYRGRDYQIHKAEGNDYYTVFSLWDTYRAEHPLLSIIDQKRTSDFINTFIAQYQQGGRLPIWELSANETFCMIGNHAIPVIADAIIKDIKGFDYEKALEAMISAQDQNTNDLNALRKYGYIPSDEVTESVSKTLEFAYDDWCVAIVAKKLGKQEDYQRFIKRAQAYKNVFDTQTGCMRPRLNGSWRSPFDPREVDFNYTEANAWQYSFYVPQDVNTLIALHGGDKAFTEQLDKMFSDTSATTGRQQSDISGLIGQYAHGNEPSHHMAYLYNFSGEANKTQALVRKIMKELYFNAPDGLCGNEDCGQMSAWYVLSAAGFYPVTPGANYYAIGSPVFDEVIFHLENGKTFSIIAKGTKDKFYIQSAKLNQKDWKNSFLLHSDIMNGGTLELNMGDKSSEWGKAVENRPKTEITENLIMMSPTFVNAKQVFYDSMMIEISHPSKDVDIYFTINGKSPDKSSSKYTQALKIDKSGRIDAIAIDKNGNASVVVSTEFAKIPSGRTIHLESSYSPQYRAGGDSALIDFKRGKTNFNDGSWQGYHGIDMIATIDLGKVQSIRKAGAGFLQNYGAWIWFPKEVEFYVSLDGKDFKLLGIAKNQIPDNAEGTLTQNLVISKSARLKYLKVVAKGLLKCPSWHPGYPSKGDAWIFADEIFVE